MAEVQVHGIGIDARWAQPLVLLQEVAGRGRIVPVWVAETDAAAIVAAQSGAPPPRPDAHTLIGNVIRAFGGRLIGVVITAMRDDVFHAELVLDGDLRIDSRASDALALALRNGVAIEVTEAVLERAGVPPDGVVTVDDPAEAVNAAAAAAAADAVDAADAASPDTEVSEVDVELFRRMLDDVWPSDFEQD